MKKIGFIFIILCMAVCLVPLVGMTVRPTTESTENRELSSFPALATEEGKPNLKFFDQFDTWFSEHFAFRNELVYADARICGDVFGVSAADGVIRGKNDWLYYSSTLNDYLGTENLTERELFNIAHNLEIARDYVEGQGADFLVAVPPNKNTLYGENMPYYNSLVVDPVHNIDRLQPLLEERGIPCSDLVGLFRNEDEVLYLKRDSHWNNKGALLAYNQILDDLGKRHDRYADVAAGRSKTEDGDLNRMLYTLYGEREVNYNYDIPQAFDYVGEGTDVEAFWIETSADEAKDSLLMFRDSFGNTLVPLVANQFNRAWFSREGQYRLEKHVTENEPDAVILEKVERNLRDLLEQPPILSAPETDVAFSEGETGGAQVTMQTLMSDIAYWEIRGTVDEKYISGDTEIFVQVGETCYRAYQTGENGFLLFLKKDEIPTQKVEINVIIRNDVIAKAVHNETIEEGDLEP